MNDLQKSEEEKILSTKDLGHEKIIEIGEAVKELYDLTEIYKDYSQFIKKTTEEEGYELYINGEFASFSRRRIGRKIREIEDLIRKEQNIVIDAEEYLNKRSSKAPVDLIC